MTIKYVIIWYDAHHEDICGSGTITPLMFNLATKWRSAVGFTPLIALHPRKEPPVPNVWEAG